MSLVIETGSIVADANSYADAQFALEFLTERGLHGDESPEDYTPFLFRAMDILNTQKWLGAKTDPTSPLPFPRMGLRDIAGNQIDSEAIPNTLMLAQVWLAYYIAEGNDPSAKATPNIKREKVDVLEVEYTAAEGSTTKVTLSSLPMVWNLIKPLVQSGHGRVIRG